MSDSNNSNTVKEHIFATNGHLSDKSNISSELTEEVNEKHFNNNDIVKLLDELRVAISKVSDIHEVFSQEDCYFLKYLASSSMANTIPDSHAINYDMINQGTAANTKSGRLCQNDIDTLIKQVEIQAKKISELEQEIYRCTMLPDDKMEALKINAKQKLRIETLEWEKHTLEKTVSDQHHIIDDLRLRALTLEKSHYEAEMQMIALRRQLQLRSRGVTDYGLLSPLQLINNSAATNDESVFSFHNNIDPSATTIGPLSMTESMYSPAMLPSGGNSVDDVFSCATPVTNNQSEQRSSSFSEVHSRNMSVQRSLAVPGIGQFSRQKYPNYGYSSLTPPSRHRDALHAHNPRYASLDRDYSHAGTSNAKVRSQQAAGVALAAAANPDTNGNAHLNPSSGKHDISRGTDARKSTFKRLFSNRWRKGGYSVGQSKHGQCHPANTTSRAAATASRPSSLPPGGVNMAVLTTIQPPPTDASAFKELDCAQLCSWFHFVGLSMYDSSVSSQKLNGKALLRMSAKQLEKELAIRHPLHVKKLYLLLNDFRDNDSGARTTCYPNFFDVAQWLDDIGLPQYKDVFAMAGVDARLLDHLTLEDLSALKITNELHCASLRRGIQVLRAVSWDINQLLRRAHGLGSELRPVSLFLEDGSIANLAGLASSAPLATDLSETPTEGAVLWSNQKLCEWLRSIDLTEYSVNLRGSGVHGGLLVLEPRFNCDLLAQLLKIPLTKSLLRRHLSTHFVALVGSIAQAEKRAVEVKGNVLSVSAKIKSTYGMGSHKRGFPALFGVGGGVQGNNLQPSNTQLLCSRPDSSNAMDKLMAASLAKLKPDSKCQVQEVNDEPAISASNGNNVNGDT